VLALLRLLEEKRANAGLPDALQQKQKQQAPDNWWSAIVFVDTKVRLTVLRTVLSVALYIDLSACAIALPTSTPLSLVSATIQQALPLA
jgi:hypothetical protein